MANRLGWSAWMNCADSEVNQVCRCSVFLQAAAAASAFSGSIRFIGVQSAVSFNVVCYRHSSGRQNRIEWHHGLNKVCDVPRRPKGRNPAFCNVLANKCVHRGPSS